ncbi:MAG TPA: AraC family transcriptional regulator [Candidatus Atribacteria bacterium]|nr:AraC family transcriptional regulator [Candidatus Atribacteria bacterium]
MNVNQAEGLLSSIPHENIIMPNAELPINFIEHQTNSTGPFCISHWHNELEIVYVKQGTVCLHNRTGSIEAFPGDILFINSNEPHGYSITEAPIVLYCTTISPTLLQGRYLTSYDSQFIPSSYLLTIFENYIHDDPAIVNHFLNLWEEGKQQERGYEYAIKSNLYGIFAILVRKYTRSTISNRQFVLKNRNIHNINKIMEYIEAHYQEDISIDELADLLNINKFYFCRLFKEITGFTPVKYINNFRVHQAIALIKQHPELSITDIATQVGYNNSNYFARVFKEVTNKSPSAFKKDWSSNQNVH